MATHYSSFFGRNEHFASLECRHSFARNIDGESHESRFGQPHATFGVATDGNHAPLRLHVGLRDSMTALWQCSSVGQARCTFGLNSSRIDWFMVLIWVTQAMSRQLRWSRNRAMFWSLPRIAMHAPMRVLARFEILLLSQYRAS